MPEIVPLRSECPHCGGGNMTCKFNHFQQGELQIHSWEHKCIDCGRRDTTAYRSDDEDLETPLEERLRCPYCQRTTPADS